MRTTGGRAGGTRVPSSQVDHIGLVPLAATLLSPPGGLHTPDAAQGRVWTQGSCTGREGGSFSSLSGPWERSPCNSHSKLEGSLSLSFLSSAMSQEACPAKGLPPRGSLVGP